MGSVLACIDGSIYSQSVCDHAAWAAGRTGAPIQLLHVLAQREISALPTDFGGGIGGMQQDFLLAELTAYDEERIRLAEARARLILDDARAHIVTRGPEPHGTAPRITTMLREGDIVDILPELERDAALLVLGKRGEAADFDRLHLGSNLERLARISRGPLLVAARAWRPIRRFLIAYDGGPSAEKAVAHIAGEPLLRGLHCEMITAGSAAGETRRRLEGAAETLRAGGFDVVTSIEPGHADDVITARVERGDIDLLVMGAYGHSRIRNLFIGSTTTSMVRSCLIPVLMFR